MFYLFNWFMKLHIPIYIFDIHMESRPIQNASHYLFYSAIKETW